MILLDVCTHHPSLFKEKEFPSCSFIHEPRHGKTNNVAVRPAKTQISLGICPVWSVFAVRMKKACVLSYPHGGKTLIRLVIVLNLLSLVTRKPDFGFCDQVRLKLTACSASETSYSLEILEIASIGIILSTRRKQRCWSGCGDAQADLRLCCSHMP